MISGSLVRTPLPANLGMVLIVSSAAVTPAVLDVTEAELVAAAADPQYSAERKSEMEL